MKILLTLLFAAFFSNVFSQSTIPQPVEDIHPVNYWWWVIGVALAIGAGIVLYMVIKKNPRRDVVD